MVTAKSSTTAHLERVAGWRWSQIAGLAKQKSHTWSLTAGEITCENKGERRRSSPGAGLVPITIKSCKDVGVSKDDWSRINYFTHKWQGERNPPQANYAEVHLYHNLNCQWHQCQWTRWGHSSWCKVNMANQTSTSQLLCPARLPIDTAAVPNAALSSEAVCQLGFAKAQTLNTRSSSAERVTSMSYFDTYQ